ncbi:ubiquitin-conjugating enzyme E2 E1 isoform X1 [Drosophila virilis]|uniref:E2 ubiquitin-conjugating enzyme n=1 Tax=Drosophila virilis TaxID=7244 RepID=B4M6X8_DROVI|nr:ubiquitin-conjugating enzyme E2 E1 isoform X1 [Drosophila virilis]EDW62545.1 uncharacterized protein Dvir_GJ16559, isoform A [Drosophila virilis]
MSNLSNVAPQKAKGSTTETMTVEEPSATMAARSLPAGDEANKDENAPSTSQGQQRGACSSTTHTTSTTTTTTTITNTNNNNNRMGSATPMTQLNGPVMRIKRELNEIIENPPPNCSAELYKEDLFHWKAIIMGPSGTPYEGGIFKLDIRFPGAYPFRPPQIRFITRIYHCNVDSRGVICLDVLNERWSPVMNIAKVLLSIWVLIGECNPNDPLVMGIADQYKCNRKEHDKVARYWTKRFAMPKAKPNSKLEQELLLPYMQEQDPAPDQEQEPQQEQQQHQQSPAPQQEQEPALSSATSSSIAVSVNHSRSEL